jgi:DNA-binding NtrC family response regulator
MAIPGITNRVQVLVADDQSACRADVRTILQPLGVAIEEAGSGEEALDLLNFRPVHILVCDMYLPRLSGLETVKLARRVHATLPCILMSGQLDPPLIRQAMEAQVYSVLGKPISRHELIYTLNRALAKTYGTVLQPDPGLTASEE